MTIVRNRAIDQARRNPAYRHVVLDDDEAVGIFQVTASLHDEVVGRKDAVALRSSVDRLPDAQGEVIRLAYFRGLSHVEIAARLALPLGTVKGRIRLGLTKLRSDIQALDWAS